MSVQAWALLTVVVSAAVGGAIKAIGWYVERITVRREIRAKAETDAAARRREDDPTIQEIYTRQVQMLIDDFRQQVKDRDADIVVLRAEIVRLQHRRRSDVAPGKEEL